jgi:hypothetical protein
MKLSVVFGTLLGIATAVTVSSTFSQTERESISVNNSRPLATVIKDFEDRYGWIVTYEDPRYVHQNDILDVTEAVRNPASQIRNDARALVPKGGRFDVTYDRPASDSTLMAVQSIVRGIVQQYNATGHPGTFDVVSLDNALHVVPVAVTAADGTSLVNPSVLEMRVSLPERKGRTVFQTIEHVLTQIENASKQKIVVGTVPTKLLMDSPYEAADANATARQVIRRALQATGRDLSWRLLYGPDVKHYALNIRVVNTRAVAR